MKKTYTKPYLVVESFQLDAAIAANCSSQGFIPIGHGEDSCTLDGEFFNLNNCQTDLTGPDGDGNDTICYHGPIFGVVFVAS